MRKPGPKPPRTQNSKPAKPKAAHPKPADPPRKRRFTQAGALVQGSVRAVSAKRGFAESRILTRWAEICGPTLSGLARPLKVSYSRAGFGATLVIACDGARAPEVQMQAEAIRSRVNAVYGYHAISRVRIQQQDAVGFAEGQRAFAAANERVSAPDVSHLRERAAKATQTVESDDLRLALEQLGAHILANREKGGRPAPVEIGADGPNSRGEPQ